MNIRVVRAYKRPYPRQFERMVKRLLKHVPKQHLLRLDSIVLVDNYVPANKGESAHIQIALETLFKGMPQPFYYLPFVAKFMLGRVLFHEVGHHTQTLGRGMRDSKREDDAKRFSGQMLRRALPVWFYILQPFRRLLRRLANRQKDKAAAE